jgi:hypothetical protein
MLLAVASQAGIPDADGVIHACYKTQNGTLRVIDDAVETCDARNETPLNWNQTGPQGPPGPGPSATADLPVPADFDGDTKSDVAVWRPTDKSYHILRSFDQTVQTVTISQAEAGAVPVPRDFDGDGKDDCAVFNPSTATWYILQSAFGTVLFIEFGNPA